MWRYFALLIFLLGTISCNTAQKKSKKILPGAYQINEYLPLIKGKRVGLFVNHSSLIEDIHITDSLISLGINVTKVFSAEHGFEGNKPDGEIIKNEFSEAFELISLYWKTKKATPEQVSDLDVLIVDIQDVGVRCYTYSSTMTYLMDACAKAGVPVIVLDRPNPNGSYVDGPVLDLEFQSFVGLHPIPLVYGMTLGELAFMINEEKWLDSKLKCDLSVIKVKNWAHDSTYELPTPPSPNLPNELAVALYPSLVLFEGTVVSVGRGTDYPFQCIGHPEFNLGSYSFTPEPNPGSKYPPLEGQLCFGNDFRGDRFTYELNISYLLSYYQTIRQESKNPFFNDYFVNLAGTDQLQKKIEAGWDEQKIRDSWKDQLDEFKALRNQYLLYP